MLLTAGLPARFHFPLEPPLAWTSSPPAAIQTVDSPLMILKWQQPQLSAFNKGSQDGALPCLFAGLSSFLWSNDCLHAWWKWNKVALRGITCEWTLACYCRSEMRALFMNIRFQKTQTIQLCLHLFVCLAGTRPIILSHGINLTPHTSTR